MVNNHLFLLMDGEDTEAFLEKIKSLSYFNSYSILHDAIITGEGEELINNLDDLNIPEGTTCKLFKNPGTEIMRWYYDSSNLNKAYLVSPDKDYKPTHFIFVKSVEL